MAPLPPSPFSSASLAFTGAICAQRVHPPLHATASIDLSMQRPVAITCPPPSLKGLQPEGANAAHAGCGHIGTHTHAHRSTLPSPRLQACRKTRPRYTRQEAGGPTGSGRKAPQAGQCTCGPLAPRLTFSHHPHPRPAMAAFPWALPANAHSGRMARGLACLRPARPHPL